MKSLTPFLSVSMGADVNFCECIIYFTHTQFRRNFPLTTPITSFTCSTTCKTSLLGLKFDALSFVENRMETCVKSLM